MDILWIGTTPHPVFNSHLSGLWTIFRIPGIPIPKPWFVTGMHPGSRVVYPDSIGCNLSQGFQVWCSLPIYMWLILYGFHVGILNIIYIPYTHGFLSMGYDAMSVSKGFPWWTLPCPPGGQVANGHTSSTSWLRLVRRSWEISPGGSCW